MLTTSSRSGVIDVTLRNYWWVSTVGGLYFVVSFALWGGSLAAVLSASVFVLAGILGLVAHHRLEWPDRRWRTVTVLGHMLIGHCVLVWQKLYLPITDFTHSGNLEVRDDLVYLVSALLLGTMSMFGGLWGSVIGLAMHFAFIFDVHDEFSFKWAFPVLIALAGNIMHSASRRLELAYEDVERLASHDSLTGLLNRYRLPDEFARVQHVARVRGRAMLLVAWDLDELKHVNDTKGHAAGDQYIRDFASALTASVRNSSDARSGDAAFRVGGDEFVSLHLDAPEGMVLLARVHQQFPKVSAGWVRCDTLSLDDAMRMADAALYSDKSERRAVRVV
jgi:diguanylate cyclase (GGDEF)-like protein